MAKTTTYWELEAQKTRRVVEAMVKATAVFGSRHNAAIWMERPALGLDHQKPIDIVLSAHGLADVLTYLERIEYGVYC